MLTQRKNCANPKKKSCHFPGHLRSRGREKPRTNSLYNIMSSSLDKAKQHSILTANGCAEHTNHNNNTMTAIALYGCTVEGKLNYKKLLDSTPFTARSLMHTGCPTRYNNDYNLRQLCRNR